MYKFVKEVTAIKNKSTASKAIGISRVYLSNILNGNVLCSKPVAYCITKFINKEAEIKDYFVIAK